jgi:hypothetical protein
MRRFNSNTKKSGLQRQPVVNNKMKIKNFHNEILQHSAMQIRYGIDEIDVVNNKFILYNLLLDYGTQSPDSMLFEVLVYGIQIQNNYEVKQVGNNVEIILGEPYIDLENILLTDIYIIGKFTECGLTLESDEYQLLTTENEEFIIL